jgi:hypothetical protein
MSLFRSRVVPLSLLIAACLCAPEGKARADDVYTFVIQKQEAKRKSGWSLQDWLDTRDRMRLMDLWLALHSPTPYEFWFGGTLEGGSPAGSPSYTAWKVDAGAFVQIFGLTFKREFSPIDSWEALLNLRIFGVHEQGTHITLQGGLRGDTGSDPVRNPVGGATIGIQLLKTFGVETVFRRHFPSTPGTPYSRGASHRWDLNGTLDFSFARLTGGWFSSSEGAGNTGWQAGLRLYF